MKRILAAIAAAVLTGCAAVPAPQLTTETQSVSTAPAFVAEAQGVKIRLYTEPCELKAVSNLTRKATWEEKGEISPGCWAPQPDAGVVIAYFASDRTVAVIPISLFARTQGS